MISSFPLSEKGIERIHESQMGIEGAHYPSATTELIQSPYYSGALMGNFRMDMLENSMRYRRLDGPYFRTSYEVTRTSLAIV
jgi:hypothetical protein